MVTAWSPWRINRTRTDAGPLLRVLTLAVLLFGVFMTHGGHVEGAKGHLSTSATAAASSADGVRDAAAEPLLLAATEASDHHGGHVPSQPGEHCASGQPQQGSALVWPSRRVFRLASALLSRG
jgi:hypothetical protein